MAMTAPSSSDLTRAPLTMFSEEEELFRAAVADLEMAIELLQVKPDAKARLRAGIGWRRQRQREFFEAGIRARFCQRLKGPVLTILGGDRRLILHRIS